MLYLLPFCWKERNVLHISKIVIFIALEEVVLFFGSNIKCFEYLKLIASNVLRSQLDTGKLFYYQWPAFYHTLSLVILRDK